MILKERLQPNPIIVKELRSRMRGARAFIILTIMLLALAGALYGIYRLTMLSARYQTIPGPYIGQSLFQSLLMLEMLVICMLTPALTAGAISGEREKLTYEMLLTTPLSPTRILWGKLISALSYILLLLVAAIPLASIVFIFGGVTPMQLVRSFLVLTVVALLLGTVGIFMSAWLGRSGRATVMSYLFVLLLFVSPIIALIAIGVSRQQIPPYELLMINPLSFLFSATLPAPSSSGVGMRVFNGLGFVIAGRFDVMEGDGNILRPLYHYSLPLYLGLTLAFYMLAAQLVKPTRRWRIDLRSGLIAFVIVALVAGFVVYGFYSTKDRYGYWDAEEERFIPPVQPEIIEAVDLE